VNRRRLSKKEALEQLFVCRLRFAEALDLFGSWGELRTSEVGPSDKLEKAYRANTLRTAFLSWLASLIDKRKDAVNIFDGWVTLFPAEEAHIRGVWESHKTAFELLRDFRNVTGFHGNKGIANHIKVRRGLVESRDGIEAATRALLALSIYMLKLERKSDDARDAIEQHCKALGLNDKSLVGRLGY
jgi:hypothetical protein